jgi:hypothetical protein
MERAQELAVIRRAYAKQILALAQVDDQRLEQAFAQVPREDFLGPFAIRISPPTVMGAVCSSFLN